MNKQWASLISRPSCCQKMKSRKKSFFSSSVILNWKTLYRVTLCVKDLCHFINFSDLKEDTAKKEPLLGVAVDWLVVLVVDKEEAMLVELKWVLYIFVFFVFVYYDLPKFTSSPCQQEWEHYTEYQLHDIQILFPFLYFTVFACSTLIDRGLRLDWRMSGSLFIQTPDDSI